VIERVSRRVPVALFAISGVLYLVRALMDLGNPLYYDPATLFDDVAVITTILSMVVLAAGIASLALTTRSAVPHVSWPGFLLGH